MKMATVFLNKRAGHHRCFVHPETLQKIHFRVMRTVSGKNTNSVSKFKNFLDICKKTAIHVQKEDIFVKFHHLIRILGQTCQIYRFCRNSSYFLKIYRLYQKMQFSLVFKGPIFSVALYRKLATFW